MASDDGATMLYSIQRTYILNVLSKPGREILTCEQRIDIPTIEPLTESESVLIPRVLFKIIPCIELAGVHLDVLDLTFETNEGVTVLPVKVVTGQGDPLENPYKAPRYVLVLPRGTTGVKSCKIIHKVMGFEVQHNFTFGIMPQPYNYDNALFGLLSYTALANNSRVNSLEGTVSSLNLTTTTPTFALKDLPKGAGKQTITIEPSVLFYDTVFIYPTSSEPTTHKPKITLHGGGRDFVYTLSLNKTTNTVSIDLFTGMITVYASVTGEIIQQFKLAIPYQGFGTLSFEGFDDIDDSALRVIAKGARVS